MSSKALNKGLDFPGLRSARTPDEKRIEQQLTEFRDRLSREVAPFADTSEAAARRRYDACERSVEAFGHTYTPHYFTSPSATYHADLDVIALSAVKHLHVVHGPREHAKSVRLRVALMQRILFGTLHYPLFISEDLKISRAHVRQIYADLVFNRRITTDFQIEVLKYSEAEGLLELRVTPRATRQAHQVQLEAASYGTAVKGKIYFQHRPDFVLFDDFQSTRKARNEELSKEMWSWILQEVWGAMRGPLVWLGNVGADTSAMYRAMLQVCGGSKDRVKRFLQRGTRPGLVALAAGTIEEDELGLPHPPEEDEGDDESGAATDGTERGRDFASNASDPSCSPEDGSTPARGFYPVRTLSDAPDRPDVEPPPDGGDSEEQDDVQISIYCYRAERLAVTPDGDVVTEYLWPQCHPPSWYRSTRATVGPAIYESEYNGNPVREGDFFKRAWFEGDVFWTDLPDTDLGWYTWFDPAFGESKSACFKAIVVACTDGHDFFIVDAYMSQEAPVGSVIEAWYGLFRKYDRQGLRHGGYENDFKQDARLARDLRDAEKRNGWMLPVSSDSNTRASKPARIESLQPLAENGRLRFPKRMNAHVEVLFNQLLAYPHGYDDGPDALESTIARMRRRVMRPLEYESLAPRRNIRSGRRRRR